MKFPKPLLALICQALRLLFEFDSVTLKKAKLMLPANAERGTNDSLGCRVYQ